MTDGNELIHSFGGTADSEPNFAGLTKREYFAAMALSGISSKQGVLDSHDWNFLSKHATQAADALIAELNKKVEPK